MNRTKHGRLFIPLATALLISGTVAALSDAGLFGRIDAVAAMARSAALEAAGLPHGAPAEALAWPVVLASLTAFSVAVAAAFRRLSWLRAVVAATGIVGGLVLLSAAAARYMATDLPITCYALVTVCFAAICVLRATLAGVRGRTGQCAWRRRVDVAVRHIIEHRILGIVTISGRGMIGSMNPAAQIMLGYGAFDLSGTHVRHLFPDVFSAANESRSMEDALQVDGGAFETRAIRFGGDKVPVEVTVTRLPVEGGTQYSAFIRDLTVFRNQQRMLEQQALHDSLTGLPNRMLFMRRLDDAIEATPARGRRSGLAVLLLDLDRFKEVNNTLGHSVGDRALRLLSRRLSDALPEGATLARLGGDEFAILSPGGTNAATAESLAGRIRAALEGSLDVDSIRLELDGSVGVALWPQHADSAAQLMQRADVAMYAAKQTPGRVALYDAAQDESSLRRLTLSGDLRRAVKDGQLFLQYQPKVDLETRRPSGVEALVRWRHPEYGAVPPDDFIEHAELTGAIIPLSEWVLSTAVERCAAWRDNGLEIDVAVNISARLLLYPDLAELVKTALARSGLPAERLVLEVTESALMVDPDRAQTTLRALKEMGVRLAIDDYGTGYSSLAYLTDLNADELKIDKRFVQRAADNPNDRTIVGSTIQLAHSLGLKVVAEGIEDERCHRLLRRLGCDTGQGFYFAKPLSDVEIVEWAHNCASERAARKPRRSARKPRASRTVARRALAGAEQRV